MKTKMYRIKSLTPAYKNRISAYEEVVIHPAVEIEHGVFYDKFKAEYIFRLLTENEDEMISIAKMNNLNYNRRDYFIQEVEMEISVKLIK